MKPATPPNPYSTADRVADRSADRVADVPAAASAALHAPGFIGGVRERLRRTGKPIVRVSRDGLTLITEFPYGRVTRRKLSQPLPERVREDID